MGATEPESQSDAADSPTVVPQALSQHAGQLELPPTRSRLTNEELEGVPIGSKVFDQFDQLKEFHLLRVLGRGGMGVVYEAIERKLNRRVALKVLPGAALVDVQQIERFKNEAMAVAQLNHPCIVPIYSVSSECGIHYYAMRLIEGQNLAQVIHSINEYVAEKSAGGSAETPRDGNTRTRPTSPSGHSGGKAGVISAHRCRSLSAEDFAAARSSQRNSGAGRELYRSIASVGAEIADALFHAHQNGVIHRDVKPANIMLDLEGKPWLTDFGLAIVKDNPGGTVTGDVVGTLRYMSPEQASGRKFLIDQRTDIYSLGVTLYELVTLQKSFSGTDARELIRQVTFDEPRRPRSINRNIPAELEIIISKAMSKNPYDRYQSAAELADDLDRFASDRPINARRASLATRLRRWVYSHQTLATAAAIGLVITLLSSITASGFILSALASEQKAHQESDMQRRRSEGLRMTALSALQLQKNPGLALALAVKASELTAGREVNSALLSAFSENHEQKTLEFRDAPERTVDLSPDGRLAVSTAAKSMDKSPGLGALVFDTTTGNMVSELKGQPSVTSAIFHPASRHVLLASSLGFTRKAKGEPVSHRSNPAMIFSIEKGATPLTFAGSRAARVSRECMSADGRFVVLPGESSSVTVYRMDNAERVVNFSGHTNQVMLAVLSQDGTTAASIDSTGVVCIWGSQTADPVKTIPAQKPFNENDTISFSANAERLAIATSTGVSIHAVREETLAADIQLRNPMLAMNPRFNRSASYWDVSKTIVIRSVESGDVLAEHVLTHAPTFVQYSDDGYSLLVGQRNEVLIIDEASGDISARFKGHTGPVLAAALSPGMDKVVSTSLDSTIRIWSVKPQLDRDSIALSTWAELPADGSISSMGSSIASSSNDRSFTYAIRPDINEPVELAAGQIKCPLFRSDHVAVFEDHQVRVIDANTGRRIAERRIPFAAISDAMACGATVYVLLQTNDGTVFRWQTDDQSLLQLTPRQNPASSCSVTADGKTAALGLQDGTCLVIDVLTGVAQRTLKHTSAVVFTEFIEGSTSLVTVDGQNTLRLWDGMNPEPKLVLSNPDSRINAACISATQKLIVGYDTISRSVACCWNLETGELKHTADLPGNSMVALSQTLPRAAIASLASGTQLWNLENGGLTELSAYSATDVEFLGQEVVVCESGPMPDTSRVAEAFAKVDGAAALRYFNADTGEKNRDQPLALNPVSLSIDQQNRTICVTAQIWSVFACDVTNHSVKQSAPHPAPWTVVRYIGDTGQMAVASSAGEAQILDQDANMVRKLVSQASPFLCGTVSSDGKLFATGDLSGSIRVWEIDSGLELPTPGTHRGAVKSLTFDPTNHFLVSSSSDATVRRWDLRTKQSTQVTIANGVQAVHLSQDGKTALLITGRDDWEPGPEQPGHGLTVVSHNVESAAALLLNLATMDVTKLAETENSVAGGIDSKTGRVATVSDTGLITLTDLNSLKPSGSAQSNRDQISAISFNEDGSLLAVLEAEHVSIREIPGLREIWNYEMPNGFTEHHPTSARHYWSPFIHNSTQVLLVGEGIRFLPVSPATFAKGAQPRLLSVEEMLEFEIED